MKRIYTAFFCICTFTIICQAQHETDHWYFGTNGGMNFTSGSPVSLSDGMTNTTEGSAAISDDAGNLLFYTDGVTVWNQSQNIMVNGTGLHGGISSTQSALILPQPGSDSLYYIFNAGEYGSNGFEYSVVDMSLQSGEGEVILKNVSVLTGVTEKLTAAKHANGTDYWIITHDVYNNRFYACLFDNTGLNATPVISNVGTINNDYIGYMKSSHQGHKIALAEHSDDFCELFDFDQSTGEVSNSIYLSMPLGLLPYGIEFSPNDSILYATAYTPSIVFQWDISSGNSATINASQVAVDTSAQTFIGALQLASDGKIYVARYLSNVLGVINNPNIYGTGCNYDDNGFTLSTGSAQLGLPNFIMPAEAPSLLPSAGVSSSDSSICEKFCVNYFDLSTNNPTSWSWSFPGGVPSTSTDQNPANICYQTPGVYDVILIATNSYGSDTIALTNYMTVFSTPPFPVISQSGYTLTSSPASTYQWQFNSVDIPGATNQSYDVLQTGYYTVVISDENGCITAGTTYVLITGIQEISDEVAVTIYFNPSDGNFVIESLNADSKIENIVLYNLLGQVMYSSDDPISGGEKREIYAGNINSGAYFMELRSKNNLIRKELVIAK